MSSSGFSAMCLCDGEDRPVVERPEAASLVSSKSLSVQTGIYLISLATNLHRLYASRSKKNHGVNHIFFKETRAKMALIRSPEN